MPKNWFGLKGHPTDTYIHWSVSRRGEEERLALAKQLREAYDKISAANLEKELDFLLRAAYNCGALDENDANAGEGM